MNDDSLAALWHSSANQPAALAGERLAAHFVARLQRRRRWQVAWLAWTFLALAAGTLLAASQLARHGFDSRASAGALLPLLTLPWCAAIYFWRQFRRERVVPRGVTLPLIDALAAALAANRAECRRLTLIGALLAAMLPVTALAIWSLRAAGKAPGHQAWSMAAVLALGLTGGLLAVVLRRRALRRAQRHLAAHTPPAR